MKRKIEITFETEEQVLYKTRPSYTGFCPHCQMHVELQLTESADTISDSATDELFLLKEEAEKHSIEAKRVLVCRNPLKNWANSLKNRFENIGRFSKTSARK